jgi:hypothetical protein
MHVLEGPGGIMIGGPVVGGTPVVREVLVISSPMWREELLFQGIESLV